MQEISPCTPIPLDMEHTPHVLAHFVKAKLRYSLHICGTCSINTLQSVLSSIHNVLPETFVEMNNTIVFTSIRIYEAIFFVKEILRLYFSRNQLVLKKNCITDLNESNEQNA